ncbi:MAG: SGNH/GDSL hydrolase family protein [Lachnospiraceae bacterium]|nr:SGNH/GDSL hydrolase family protein [Lachnospiraceae bacterium]
MEKSNLSRLKNCMYRAMRGEELTIGFLGGSITQGSLATKPENTYAYRVFSWWVKTFPQAEFHYVNGGIGGTTSHYGAARAVNDVLMYQPDFVAVDFSVNDEPDTFFQETYEGVIRKLLCWQSAPAVLLLNNVYYDTGMNAQEYHNAVGDWYRVPHVSIKDTVYQRMKNGEYTRNELTQDGLHPNDKGHGLLADEIIAFLEGVKENLHVKEEDITMPEPMTSNAYENAVRLTIQNCTPELFGFHADAEEKMGHLDHFKNGWIGKKAGESIVFEVTASCIAVQYRKTIRKPALRAKLTLDGDASKAVLLDGNFDEDWGDCLYLEPVLHHGTKTKHTVEIEILPDKMKAAEALTPFYLMSLIIA